MQTESAEHQRRLCSFQRMPFMVIDLRERYAVIVFTLRQSTGSWLSAKSNSTRHRWSRTHWRNKWRIMVRQIRLRTQHSACIANTGTPPPAFSFCLKHAAFEFLTQLPVRLGMQTSLFLDWVLRGGLYSPFNGHPTNGADQQSRRRVSVYWRSQRLSSVVPHERNVC